MCFRFTCHRWQLAATISTYWRHTFSPGMPPAAELAAMTDAVKQGIVVVQSSRAGSGRIHRSQKLAKAGVLAADNLNPQKARLLLALALTRTSDPAEIERIFATY